jgi:hypothetical protein
MIGYKVLSKDGLKGPFKKSSILKAITTATLPLQARLLDLSTGLYIRAAELVGEEIEKAPPALELVAQVEAESPQPEPAAAAPAVPPKEERPRVILSGKVPLKRVRLPNPRKLRQQQDELELNYPAA